MQKLGKYEIHEKLGEGATAEVFRAIDTSLGREVALKILKPALVADASAFARFVQEARAAAGLFHSNIATVLEVGEEVGRYFIAMRYVPGKPLSQVIKETPLPLEEVVILAKQVAEALDYAHKKGFLHRDVKPSNIIQVKAGEYVLTDFGLARALMSSGFTSHSGAALGTPSYIAPEIWLNQPATQATDQYALACVIYEALTGEVLFTGDTPPAIMTSHVMNEPRLPRGTIPGIPAATRSVINRALAKDPVARFASVGEFARDIDRSIGVAAERLLITGKKKLSKEREGHRTTSSISQRASASDSEIPPAGIGIRKGRLGLKLSGIVMLVFVIGTIFASLFPSLPASLFLSLTPTFTSTPKLTVTASLTSLPLDTHTATPPPTEIIDAKGVPMRLVPEGEFTMGSDAGAFDEQPLHQVILDAYYIDTFEVTNAMYKECVSAGNCLPPQHSNSFSRASYYDNLQYDGYPVININWYMSKAYCEWRGADLPTEAQWEKAARGIDGRIYPWGEEIFATFANYNNNVGDTSAVDNFNNGISPYGLFGMSGNGWEWTRDWYSETYYENSSNLNPLGPIGGDYRVLRGGSWNNGAIRIQTTIRETREPTEVSSNIGFRCARPLLSLETPPQTSTLNEQIAFTSINDGSTNLYLLDLENRTIIPIETDLDVGGFEWSHNGRYLAYRTFVPKSRIYILIMNDLHYEVLYEADGILTFEWSPLSERLAIGVAHGYSDHDGGVYIENIITNDNQKISNLEVDVNQGTDPIAWSPDNTQIALSAWGNNIIDVYLMSPDGSSLRNVTNYPDNSVGDNVVTHNLTWSPDSKYLAVMTENNISLMNKELEMTLIYSESDAFDPTTDRIRWSPDSTRLIYDDRIDRIFIAGVQDNSITVEAIGSCASWSPDGKNIIYVAPVQNGKELFLMNDKGNEQLTENMQVECAKWQP